jgi:hypothetical protein
MHSATIIAILFSFLLSFSLLAATVVKPAPLVSIPTHDNFFSSIAALCGKAFEGKVVFDNDPSPAFERKLVMHVRKCSDTQLQIPFHLGSDASRTWIITKTGSGLNLKHDHRNKDGSDDASTMYGGHTIDAGYDQAQSFPAELFSQAGNPQSNGNTWQMFIYPEKFTYRMVREGREFRVDFDLTNPIERPEAPWGYADGSIIQSAQ